MLCNDMRVSECDRICVVQIIPQIIILFISHCVILYHILDANYLKCFWKKKKKSIAYLLPKIYLVFDNYSTSVRARVGSGTSLGISCLSRVFLSLASSLSLWRGLSVEDVGCHVPALIFSSLDTPSFIMWLWHHHKGNHTCLINVRLIRERADVWLLFAAFVPQCEVINNAAHKHTQQSHSDQQHHCSFKCTRVADRNARVTFRNLLSERPWAFCWDSELCLCECGQFSSSQSRSLTCVMWLFVVTVHLRADGQRAAPAASLLLTHRHGGH